MVSKFERRKDTVQELTESGATHVGKIAMIIAGAVRDVTREIGDWITDGIEMREASKRAQADAADEEPDVVEGETDGGEGPADK
ncbi:hypothetical protein ABIC28_004755 [Rhodococcus sp. PvR044]|jgi:hypothetical protein|uniref:hypothetical protein n=1 Tax=Rhodococcus TaxID=1827 RepID=UPI00097924FE|nr:MULTISPECIES: hypothetical protein [Rhodococcus]AQA23140.1 hypothetical protein BTZ20_3828 [Rhodococcus sp. MTM3W5.2]MBP1159556.1 hypothetical protein [Rhodococcus sp. PvR099]MCZ4556606.1 hypothetical protein [Rhodococcus maanshanensis]PTR43556.1 hypothetical protein C8K38_107161 [Rhodococcus sp. OK611]SNX90901.1 hypothetical protein SAMN05447004_107161 [Rhodococcus sp. OK270]